MGMNMQNILWCDPVFFVQIWKRGKIWPKQYDEIRTNMVLEQFFSYDWLV